jgi:hypothetical protein
MQDINEEFQKRTYEAESSLKEKEQNLKELNEKYLTETTIKDNFIATLEQKIAELTLIDHKLKEENDRLKLDKGK